MSLFSLSTWSIFWAGWVKWIILGTWLLSFLNLGLIDKLLLEHVGLPHVLDLAVHLVKFFCWMSQGSHSEKLLFFALFYQSSPSCLKVRGGVVGGPCDFSVSPRYKSFFFSFFGGILFNLEVCWDRGLDQGLKIIGYC